MTFTQVESLHLTDNGQRITLANPKLRLIIAARPLKPSSKQPKPNLVLRWCRGARVLRVSAVKRFGLPSYGWTTPFSPSDCGPKAFFPPQSTAISLQVNYQPLLLAVFRRMRRGSPEEALHLRVSLHGRTRMTQKTKPLISLITPVAVPIFARTYSSCTSFCRLRYASVAFDRLNGPVLSIFTAGRTCHF